MAVFVRVTVAFWVLPKAVQRDFTVLLTPKGGPWIPIALPNAYTLSHILFCCLYVHQVLDMYDSHSFIGAKAKTSTWLLLTMASITVADFAHPFSAIVMLPSLVY